MSKDLYKTTAKILYKLGERLELSDTKAALSDLRRSIGKDISETVTIWPFIFEEMPVEYLSETGFPTYQENAILTSLQLYAIHQQGKNLSVHNASGENVGKSLHQLRGVDSVAIDRRFNALITSSDFKELTTHLRHLIKILKQKSETKIDYAKLAVDFYWYQISLESANRMRMSWGQSYYFYQIKEEGEKNGK